MSRLMVRVSRQGAGKCLEVRRDPCVAGGLSEEFLRGLVVHGKVQFVFRFDDDALEGETRVVMSDLTRASRS